MTKQPARKFDSTAAFAAFDDAPSAEDDAQAPAPEDTTAQADRHNTPPPVQSDPTEPALSAPRRAPAEPSRQNSSASQPPISTKKAGRRLMSQGTETWKQIRTNDPVALKTGDAKVSITVSHEIHRELKLLALHEGTTVQAYGEYGLMIALNEARKRTNLRKS